ncbi:hypothetical protein [Streptomyces sp. S584]|uniref:hypothetical protein n=1 Tax=Streptomyces sp. S584 TaxID=3096010 RepID=UPI003A4D95C6
MTDRNLVVRTAQGAVRGSQGDHHAVFRGVPYAAPPVGAHAAHAGSRTFRYEFAWRSPALGGELGAAHTVEVPFVFDVTDQPGLLGADALLGAGAPPAELAARTHAAWIAFARTGAPGWAPYERGNGHLMRVAEEWETVPGRRPEPSPSAG